MSKSEVPDQSMKKDLGKTRLELFPGEMLEGVSKVLTFGAQKYSSRGWEAGMEWGRAYGALLRHLNAWHAGEDLDAETGLNHLYHAGCELGFLIAFQARGIGTDDRPKATVLG